MTCQKLRYLTEHLSFVRCCRFPDKNLAAWQSVVTTHKVKKCCRKWSNPWPRLPDRQIWHIHLASWYHLRCHRFWVYKCTCLSIGRCRLKWGTWATCEGLWRSWWQWKCRDDNDDFSSWHPWCRNDKSLSSWWQRNDEVVMTIRTTSWNDGDLR